MNTDRFLTRVFDKQEKKMIYFGDEFCYGTQYYCLFGIDPIKKQLLTVWNYEPFRISMEDRFVPMQCFGRKDKNGKLIYEDDIIKCWRSDVLAEIIKIIWNKGRGEWRATYITEIYHNKFLSLTHKSESLNAGFVLDLARDTKILGNIHENPEMEVTE